MSPDVSQTASVSWVIWHFLVDSYLLLFMFMSEIQVQVYDKLFGQLTPLLNRDNSLFAGVFSSSV